MGWGATDRVIVADEDYIIRYATMQDVTKNCLDWSLSMDYRYGQSQETCPEGGEHLTL